MNKFLDAVLLRRADEQVEAERTRPLCTACRKVKPQSDKLVCYKCYMKLKRSQLHQAMGTTPLMNPKKGTCR